MEILKEIFSAESLVNYIGSGIIIAIAIVIWRIIKVTYTKFNEKRNLEPSNHLGISFIKYVLIVVVVLAILQINGVNITSLVASLGIVGAVGALAVQDFLKDVIMGMHISADKFFVLGDVVKYGDIEGEVTLLTLRTTKIRELKSGNILSICNRNISEITLVSELQSITIPLPYELPSGDVAVFFKELCPKIDEVENVSESAFRGAHDLESSDISYLLTYHCDPKLMLQAKRDVREVILRALAERGWEVPYEHVVVEQA